MLKEKKNDVKNRSSFFCRKY